VIKAIIFDAGGVLFNSKEALFNGPIEHISKITGKPSDVADKAYRETIKECESKEVDEKYLWEDLINRLGLKIPFTGQNPIAEGFKRFKFTEGITSLIQQLKPRYKLAIVSNANAVEEKIARPLSLYDQVHVVVLSYQVGVRKPDPKIYKEAFKRLEVNPSEVVFVDDTPENVEEARELGMVGVLFESTEQLKQELSKVGVALDL
jgi:putative hydrolase of the HAD superfamily